MKFEPIVIRLLAVYNLVKNEKEIKILHGEEITPLDIYNSNLRVRSPVIGEILLLKKQQLLPGIYS